MLDEEEGAGTSAGDDHLRTELGVLGEVPISSLAAYGFLSMIVPMTSLSTVYSRCAIMLCTRPPDGPDAACAACC